MTATISLKKFDKLDQQVKASLNFMMTLCVKCSSGPTIFRVSEIIRNKESNLPRLIMQALEDLGYIKCEGALTGKKYHWVKTTPTEEQAQAVVDKARQADIEYKRNYIAERSGYKETIRSRLSRTNGTRSTGNFVFKGKDGSLGYKNGEHYHLSVLMSFEGGKEEVVIGRINPANGTDNNQRCVYSSSKAFNNNWSCFELYSGPDLITNYKQLTKGIPIELDQILENLKEEVNGKN